MVAKPNFFTKILELMLDNEVALALTPQGFNNVDAQSDIFNNLNLSFWEYMLPGTDALGYIACTGTNFCLRCNALADCGWFPTFSITEDYTLGMMLKAKGYKAGYLNEYLAIGEAPEEIRNIFRQRSRWCKGQMQVRRGGSLGLGLGAGGTGGWGDHWPAQLACRSSSHGTTFLPIVVVHPSKQLQLHLPWRSTATSHNQMLTTCALSCCLQVLFSHYCPLFDTGLTLGMRLLYTSVTWSYITNTFAVPCSVLVPFIALVFGIYPLVLNRDFALASTLYFTASTLVTNVSDAMAPGPPCPPSPVCT
jgi:cellulose synthase/poly-beta-1,6-N-acetylglucosamine synthase-like glycosyltransferase